ncbi:hypothetical protein UFOVP25_1, partial [uncultured Caudovirales phage]
SDVLVGLDINPTFTNGAFTGVTNAALRTVTGNVLFNTTSGSVGIGTTSPANKLDVNGSMTLASDGIMGFVGAGNALTASNYAISGNSTQTVINTQTGGKIETRINNSPTSRFNSSGLEILGSGINSSIKLQNTGVITFSSAIDYTNYALYGDATSTSLNAPTSGNIALRVGNSEKARISSGGNILINTSTDAGFRLDVNGTARVQSFLYIGPNPSGAFIYGNGYDLNITTRAQDKAIFCRQTGGTYITCAIGSDGNSGGSNNNVFTAYYNGTTSQNASPAFSINGISGNLILNGNTDVASSILTMNATTKGFLPPRMTTTQRDAIASPATGLQVYNTTTNTNDFYNGSAWVSQSATTTASGTYTPTIGLVTNAASSTARVCQYMRVGSVVTVSGYVTVTATTPGTSSRISMTLPISSSFTSTAQAGGAGGVPGGQLIPTVIFANSTATTVSMDFTPISGATDYWFSYTYQIL